MTTTSALILLAGIAVCLGQETVDRRRELWSTEFKKQRAAESKPAVAPAKPAPVAAETPVLLGVTIWHLKPSREKDPATVRAIVHEKSNRPHTPVRVTSESRFYAGDHLRLAVEAGKGGYLYVASRERYSKGPAGPYQLIFPTTRLRGGDNRVRPGFPIEIPAGSDDPSYFTLERSRADHLGEEVVFILAPRPIDGLRIGEGTIELSEETVRSWQQKWTTKVESVDLPLDPDPALTPAEVKLMRANAGYSPQDPLPQTLFRLHGSPNQPVLMTLQLRMSE